MSNLNQKNALEYTLGLKTEYLDIMESHIDSMIESGSVMSSHPIINPLVFYTLFNLNQKYYNFELTFLSELEICYGDYQYSPFVDEKTEHKLTCIFHLNENYSGGEIVFPEETFKIPAGDLIVYPSFKQPIFNSVTEGTRKLIISHMIGPCFK